MKEFYPSWTASSTGGSISQRDAGHRPHTLRSPYDRQSPDARRLASTVHLHLVTRGHMPRDWAARERPAVFYRGATSHPPRCRTASRYRPRAPDHGDRQCSSAARSRLPAPMIEQILPPCSPICSRRAGEVPWNSGFRHSPPVRTGIRSVRRPRRGART